VPVLARILVKLIRAPAGLPQADASPAEPWNTQTPESAYEWFSLLGSHEIRHRKQMRGIAEPVEGIYEFEETSTGESVGAFQLVGYEIADRVCKIGQILQ
jgi:hypothetical protein